MSQESLQSLRTLQVKHREWQETLKDLLADAKAAEIGRDEKVQKVYQVEEPPQPKTSLVSAASLQSVSQSVSSLSSFVAPLRAPLRSHTGRKAIYGQERTLSRLSNKSGVSTRSRLQSLRQSTLERLPNIVLEVLMDDTSETVEEKSGMCQSEMCRKLSSVVDSQAFEYITGFLILLNMALIGMEAEMQLQGMDTAWASNIERGFLTLYSLELLVRLVAGGFSIFKSPWHLLDLLLVSVGLLALVLVPLLEQSGQEDWERLLIIRGLRLLRLARVLRTLRHFKVVWRLVSGLLSAWDTLASTMGLILLWLYIFGCVAIEVIANDQVLLDNTVTKAIIERNFSPLACFVKKAADRRIFTECFFASLLKALGVSSRLTAFLSAHTLLLNAGEGPLHSGALLPCLCQCVPSVAVATQQSAVDPFMPPPGLSPVPCCGHSPLPLPSDTSDLIYRFYIYMLHYNIYIYYIIYCQRGLDCRFI